MAVQQRQYGNTENDHFYHSNNTYNDPYMYIRQSGLSATNPFISLLFNGTLVTENYM